MPDEEDPLKAWREAYAKMTKTPVPYDKSLGRVCETCAYWERFAERPPLSEGVCRRRAPDMPHRSHPGYARWPITDKADWCGDHVPQAIPEVTQ